MATNDNGFIMSEFELRTAICPPGSEDMGDARNLCLVGAPIAPGTSVSCPVLRVEPVCACARGARKRPRLGDWRLQHRHEAAHRQRSHHSASTRPPHHQPDARLRTPPSRAACPAPLSAGAPRQAGVRDAPALQREAGLPARAVRAQQRRRSAGSARTEHAAVPATGGARAGAVPHQAVDRRAGPSRALAIRDLPDCAVGPAQVPRGLRLRAMSRTGQILVDVPEATVKVLADFPDFVLTYMRSRTEGGPGRHLHREHADGFIVLEGEYAFELGDERATRGAGHRARHPARGHPPLRARDDRPGRVPQHPRAGDGLRRLPVRRARARGRRQHLRPARGGGPPGERGDRARVRRGGRGRHRQARADDPHPRRPARARASRGRATCEGEEGPGPHIHKEHSTPSSSSAASSTSASARRSSG